MSEADVEERLAERFARWRGPVAVAMSGQNLDSLVSVFRAAARARRILVLDLYQAYVLHRLAFLSARLPQHAWAGVRVKQGHRHRRLIEAAGEDDFLADVGSSSIRIDRLAAMADRAVLLVRSYAHSVRVLQAVGAGPDTLLVWSLWRGYWDRPDRDENDPLRSWAEAS
ncbi:MAG: hypothetical protein JXB39_00020 [Deltaproteobacteria bacterium]|nr:hypothetical protein [Deltaproteobacteria bacterium]